MRGGADGLHVPGKRSAAQVSACSSWRVFIMNTGNAGGRTALGKGRELF